MRVIIELDSVRAEIVDTNAITLSDALVLTAQALRGAGYHFDGELDIVSPEGEE